LNGAVRYYDGLTNDARLVLDTLRSAARYGALLLNYTKFKNAQFTSGEWKCELEDHEKAEGPRYFVRARAIVNATGPWADGLQHSAVKLRLTKGIHCVVEKNRVPVPDAVVMTEGKRILFAIPWGDRTILGTTDTDYRGSMDRVHADEADIAYVVKIVNQHFPGAKLTSQDVISTWAGLRPLIADPNGKPSDISRSHQIKSPEPYWWDVAGGKLTTYRLMAEQAVDQIVKKLNLSAKTCRTAKEPLLPQNEVNGLSGITPPKFTRNTVEHQCRSEWAVHLDDVMVRRTSWHYYFRDAEKRAGQVADWMAEIQNWSAAEKETELQRYRNSVNPKLPEGKSAATMSLSPK
jgi:glycerol-3-phosphate dehydrogenase